jgi:threonylcarbamoyladenosine tRNA methylthiotransferase MtaB
LDAEDTNHAFHPSYSHGGRSRTFFKIQDGCDYFCNYCIIPYARGRSRSATVKESIALIGEATAGGCNELVLTGVNIGDYGRKNGESLLMLLEGLKDNENIKRIRLSSVEPDLLDEGIISLFASEKRFMPHFHIPLQSGSDGVLKAMGRRYTTALFMRVTESIKKHLPHACIGTDIICGFPGESEKDFNDAVDFLDKSILSYMHVFRYSERPGTRAAEMDSNITSAEKTRRSKILLELSDKKKKQFYDGETGKIRHLEGYTENYLRVRLPFESHLKNSIQQVMIEGFSSFFVASGRIINQQLK